MLEEVAAEDDDEISEGTEVEDKSSGELTFRRVEDDDIEDFPNEKSGGVGESNSCSEAIESIVDEVLRDE